jgi:hypothetical protein
VKQLNKTKKTSRCKKEKSWLDCLLPLPHSPWAFIQTRLSRLLLLYDSYFQTTSRVQKLLSLILTQLKLYLNLTPSTTQTPCLDLLGSGFYLILISSPTQIHMISSLNRTCISLILPCAQRSLIQSKEESSLKLPGQLTQIAYLIGLPAITRALPKYLTQPPYLGSTRVLTQTLPEHLTRSGTPYPALPDCLTQSNNSLLALSKVFYLSQ